MKKLLLFVALLLPQVAVAQPRFIKGVRVTVAPPALRMEAPPPAPTPRHQWIAGYWGWRTGKHVWMEGHWALAPAPGYVWEPARWDSQDGAWVYYEGHWRAAEQPDANLVYQPPPPPVQEVVVATPPPTPLEEVQPAAPFEGAVWIPGYWHWNGIRHVWVAGRWSARPAGYGWEGYRWEKRRDRWVHRPGHWHPR
jgi:WXXGXW repeat (2 copies)